jgi:hypothetical protein
MIYIPIFVNIVLLLLFGYRYLFFSLFSIPFLWNRFGVLLMQYTVVGTASYDGSSCQLRFAWEGRICKKCTSSRRIKRDDRLSHRIKPVR